MILALVALAADWKPPPCPFHSKAQLDACAKHDYVVAEQKMRVAWRRALQRLKAIDPRSTSFVDARGLRELATEQKAWTAWRNAHCAVVSYGLQHTSVDQSVRLDCMSRMTHDRIGEIEKVGRD